MFPLLVFLETLDEVEGGLVALTGREHQEIVRLLARDGIILLRHIALTLEVIRRARDELTLGIIVLVRDSRVVIQGIPIPKNRRRHHYRCVL